MATIFVYSSALPRFDCQSGDRRFIELLELLAQRHRVDICFQIDEADPSNPPIAIGTEKYRRRLVDIGVRLLPAGWRHVERALLRDSYDIGLFEFYFNAASILPLFRRLQPQAAVVVDSVDVHYARERGAASLGLLPPAKPEQTRRNELSVYRQADAVIAVTEEDRQVLRAESDMPPVLTVPNIVREHLRPRVPRANEAIFIGGFDHQPNIDGIVWFVTDAWPLIRSAVPTATLKIIGSNLRPAVSALTTFTGVEVLGYVPDTAPYLEAASVSIAPLRFGAGMKGKVTEAMAFGLPVVTTPLGAQGLSVTSGRELLVADDAVSLARAVIYLFEHPAAAQDIGGAGQAYIVQLCGRDAVARQVEHVVKVASALRRPASPGLRRASQRLWFITQLLFCFPFWMPHRFYRRHLKAILRSFRDRVLLRRPSPPVIGPGHR